MKDGLYLKKYVKDNIHLTELQDKYHKRLTDKGYDLKRGIKGSDRKHIKIKDYKRINQKLEQNLTTRNNKLDKAVSEFEEKMKNTKTNIFNKNQVIIDKDTFDSMNNVIKESKKVNELQPKIKKVFEEVSNYANSYNSLDMDNRKYQKEIESLKKKNTRLETENNYLFNRLEAIFKAIKEFFRKLLQIGNEIVKDVVSEEIKDYYDVNDFNSDDVKDIAIRTTKEDELFDYADVLKYYKNKKYRENLYDVNDNYGDEINKEDDFEITM